MARKEPRRKMERRWANFVPGDPTVVSGLPEDVVPDIAAGRLIPVGGDRGGNVCLVWDRYLTQLLAGHAGCRVLSKTEMGVRLEDHYGEPPDEVRPPTYKAMANEAIVELAREGRLFGFLDRRGDLWIKAVEDPNDYDQARDAFLRDNP
jgi:hypothetical protein